jgi:hypothetical protein
MSLKCVQKTCATESESHGQLPQHICMQMHFYAYTHTLFLFLSLTDIKKHFNKMYFKHC